MHTSVNLTRRYYEPARVCGTLNPSQAAVAASSHRRARGPAQLKMGRSKAGAVVFIVVYVSLGLAAATTGLEEALHANKSSRSPAEARSSSPTARKGEPGADGGDPGPKYPPVDPKSVKRVHLVFSNQLSAAAALVLPSPHSTPN